MFEDVLLRNLLLTVSLFCRKIKIIWFVFHFFYSTYSLSVASAHYIFNSAFNCCEELMNDYLATIELFSKRSLEFKHCLFCIVWLYFCMKSFSPLFCLLEACSRLLMNSKRGEYLGNSTLISGGLEMWMLISIHPLKISILSRRKSSIRIEILSVRGSSTIFFLKISNLFALYTATYVACAYYMVFCRLTTLYLFFVTTLSNFYKGSPLSSPSWTRKSLTPKF